MTARTSAPSVPAAEKPGTLSTDNPPANSLRESIESAESVIDRFTSVSEHQRLIMALWAAHTHCYTKFETTPRLSFRSNLPGSGKSVAARVVLGMCASPLESAYMSNSALYAYLDQYPNSTIFIDECDVALGLTGRSTSGKGPFMAVANAGYARSGSVVVVRGRVAVKMRVFAPLILAGLGQLPPALASRSVVLTMAPGKPKETLVEGSGEELESVGATLALTLKIHAAAISDAPPLAPVDGDPRRQQVAASLFAIARAAGIEDRFIVAANRLYEQAKQAVPTADPRLLIADILACWPEDQSDELVPGTELIMRLRQHREAAWAMLPPTLGGAKMLGALLSEHGVCSVARHGKRGYERYAIAARAESESNA